MCSYNVSARRTMKTDKFTLFLYCNFLVLLSTTVCSQNINKQNVNIGDETLTDYSCLSRYHYTKSKNYLKRRYRIRHWIPKFFSDTLYVIVAMTLSKATGFSNTFRKKRIEKNCSKSNHVKVQIPVIAPPIICCGHYMPCYRVHIQ